jgi:hypothetical protein
VSEGDEGRETGSVLSEYLAWRLMVRGDAITGRATFIRVFVNGDPLGVYVNVEHWMSHWAVARGWAHLVRREF